MADPVPPPDDPTPDLTGRTLGDFQVLRKLGQGGMGQVYLAEQLSLKRKVALKILRRDLAASPTALERFQAEAEAVARVTHANIVQVYAFGEDDGLQYMALEYVEGRNLRDYLDQQGAAGAAARAGIMRQVAAALQRASELGHHPPRHQAGEHPPHPQGRGEGRRLRPVAGFAGDGRPLNLTQTGVTMGTPLYMSPEQVEGKPVDPRTDIYSFGVTCYHMLAGQPPFRGAHRVRGGRPARPGRAGAAARRSARTCRRSCAPSSTR